MQVDSQTFTASSPVISVILPVFNGEKHLAKAIASILDQTFTDFELIVVNDGSTDRTSSILQSYTDTRLVIIERENRGLPQSLNEAIDVAQGRYIARMDADDISYSDRFKLQIEYMESNPICGILGGQAKIINDEGVLLGEALKPSGYEKVKEYLEFACPVLHPTYMVRKDVYQLLGGYRELPVEDYDFLLRASEVGVAINNLSDMLLEYRISPNGLSLRSPAKSIQMTRYIQSMHKRRISGQDEETIREQIRNYVPQADTWFRLIYFARTKAIRKFRVFQAGNNGAGKALMHAIISIISLCHYKIFIDSYLIYRASRLVYKESQSHK